MSGRSISIGQLSAEALGIQGLAGSGPLDYAEPGLWQGFCKLLNQFARQVRETRFDGEQAMATLADILSVKGSHVTQIGPSATVLEAAALMNQHEIGSLIVCDGDRMHGIVTERDILRRVIVPRRDPSQTTVREVMTRELACARRHTTVEEARGVMKNRRLRHLPILDDTGKLCGLVSIGDLNAHETNTKEMTIHLLQEYIYGHVETPPCP
jgi:CBS domain-containing protein